MIVEWKFKKIVNMVVVNTSEDKEEIPINFKYRKYTTNLVKKRYDRNTSAKKYPLPYKNY